jgi:hypothetical protein
VNVAFGPHIRSPMSYLLTIFIQSLGASIICPAMPAL